jgi:hypothetical protein
MHPFFLLNILGLTLVSPSRDLSDFFRPQRIGQNARNNKWGYNPTRSGCRWERELKDFARGKNFLAIILGTEVDPKDQKDLGWEKPKLIQEYSTRKRGAFFSLCVNETDSNSL